MRKMIKGAPAMLTIVGLIIGLWYIGYQYMQPLNMNNVSKKPHFSAVVEKVEESYIDVIAMENNGKIGINKDELLRVSLEVKLKDSYSNFKIGDHVVVYFDGSVDKGTPLIIHTVYAITYQGKNIN